MWNNTILDYYIDNVASRSHAFLACSGGEKKTDSSTRICVNISLWLSIVRYTQMTGKKFYQQWKNISDGQNFSLMQWIGHDADMSKF